MKGMNQMTKKLAMLLAMLPLVALADVVTPPWDEQVPLLNRPGGLFYFVSIIAFMALIGLSVLIGKRKRWQLIPIVVPEVAAFFMLLFFAWFFSDKSSTVFCWRTVHHPEEGPNHHYGPENIQVKCRECGEKYTTTVTHYGGGTQSDDIGLCHECRSTITNRHGADLP